MSVSLSVTSDVVRAYKRLNYTAWHALAEFVDNSTQSYFNNRESLDAAFKASNERLEVRIVYDKENDFLRISDNAMGMDLEELQQALRLGKPPANTSGRSQYGLGMKTAACWFGDEWSVRTTKLGSGIERSVTVDVDAVANGSVDLPYSEVSRPLDYHGTIVEIRRLNLKLHARRKQKIKDFLKSMYRVDIREGLLDLFWDGTQLVWDTALQFLRNAKDEPYKKDFEFEVNGKAVRGFVGVLGEGSRGRPRAGFSILRRGRVIRGHPDAWRPEEIFGQMLGSNDLVNQRIAGEVHLDDFEVSHTKDDILWQEDEEELVQAGLRAEAADYIAVARSYRRDNPDARGPSDAQVRAAVEDFTNEINSKEFVDFIEFDEVPPPDVAEQAVAPMIEAAQREEPRFVVTVGETTLEVYLSADPSPNDPYFATDFSGADIMVVINTRHPHWADLGNGEGVLNYLRHCVYDAVAEWKVGRKQAPVQPSSIKAMKDVLLRLPSSIEQAVSYVDQEAAVTVDGDSAPV